MCVYILLIRLITPPHKKSLVVIQSMRSTIIFEMAAISKSTLYHEMHIRICNKYSEMKLFHSRSVSFRRTLPKFDYFLSLFFLLLDRTLLATIRFLSIPNTFFFCSSSSFSSISTKCVRFMFFRSMAYTSANNIEFAHCLRISQMEIVESVFFR